MLKSLLIGLDGSCDGAVGLGIEWARRFDALAVGLAIVDEPGIHDSSIGLLGENRTGSALATLVAEARQHAADALRAFEARCRAAGVNYRVLEEAGTPYVEMLKESQRFDLMILPRDSHFEFAWQAENDETLTRVLRDTPRPVVVVSSRPRSGETIVVAYDGSLQAARTLAAFEATGLATTRPVCVVSVASKRSDAIEQAERASEFLEFHNVKPVLHIEDAGTHPAELILRQIERLNAGLLVMGVYGQPILREFFLGSVTKSVLKHSDVPVFCYH